MTSSDQVVKYIWERIYVYSLKGIKASPSGWRAKDFSEGKDHIWAGVLKLVANVKSDKNFVLLEHDKRDAGKTGVFAMCEALPENVDPVIDSSRFFILRISDGKGSFALLGMGFNEKQASLDFKSEFQSLNQKAANETKLFADMPKQDFSLPTGTTITMNIKGKTGGGGAKPSGNYNNSNAQIKPLPAPSAVQSAPPGGPQPKAAPGGADAFETLSSLIGPTLSAAKEGTKSADPNDDTDNFLQGFDLSGGASNVKASAPKQKPAGKKNDDFDFGGGDEWGF